MRILVGNFGRERREQHFRAWIWDRSLYFKSNNQDKRNENEDYFSDSRVHCNREALGFLL